MSQDLVPVPTPTAISIPHASGETLSLLLPPSATMDAAFIQTWLRSKRSMHTRRCYARDMERFYTCIGTSLHEVTLAEVQDFAETLYDLAVSSQARILASVKSALSFGARTGYLSFNVGAALKLPQAEDKVAERILTEAQVSRMVALETNPRNHALILLLYSAGLRAEEICHLRWRNVQERGERGQVTVYGKGNKTRSVVLKKETWGIIVALRGEADLDAYVFQSRQKKTSRPGSHAAKIAGEKLDESQLWRIVHNAAVRAGIQGNVSPHWLRHSHATHALERGAPISLVKETLGHKKLETTGRYLHVRPEKSSSEYLAL